MRVNQLTNPLGYDFHRIIFAWISDSIDVRDTRILVEDEDEEIVADTDFAKLNALGKEVKCALKPRCRYYWTVQERTLSGEIRSSDKAFFETGKMEEAWSGKWITCEKKEKRLPYFEKSFEIDQDKRVKSARLYMSGLGLYEIELNGKAITNERLAPGSYCYQDYIQIWDYDMISSIQNENRLSILLGDGWYKGRYHFGEEVPGFYGDSYLLLGEMHIEYEDGTETIISTDDTWEIKRSNILFSGIYDGEIVDDTLPKIPLERALLYEKEMPPLIGRISLPVIEHEHFNGKVIITPKNETVLDIGQNMAGIFTLRVQVPKGQKVHLQFGEVLQNGCFYRDNLRSAKAEYSYISDGEEHILRPHFTYYGYRYVKVSGIDRLDPKDFIGIALYTDIPIQAKLTTGNEKVNKLISNTIWGMKSNFVDVPTDCPQRDERMGWTGDTQVFSETACYLGQPYAFYRKYLYDTGMEQKRREGAVPDVVPAFRMKGSCSVWGDMTCILPWNMYLFSGDISILETHYEHMKAWVEYIKRTDGDSHHWREVFHYGDWLALDHQVGGSAQTRGGTDEGFIADVYYRKSALIVAKTAKLLGNLEDEKIYRALADSILRDLQDEFFSPTGRCCIHTQTGYLLTLSEGLADRYRAGADGMTGHEKAEKGLKDLLEENSGKLTTGFVGTPYLCEVLTEEGMLREAFSLLLNEDYPGWLYEINLGATTIWERWNSLDETGHISSTGMNSLNHYAYGAITGWIFKRVAGIRPDQSAPGFRKAVIEPHVSNKLKELHMIYPTLSGTYEICWKVIDINHLYVKVVVPVGCTARLSLPLSNDEAMDLSSGTYEYTYETCKPVWKGRSVEDKLKELLMDYDVRTLISNYFPDIYNSLSFTGDYPFRETLTNWGYDTDFIEKLGMEINKVAN